MSDFIDISMVGDKKLQRKLKKLSFNLQKKVVRNAINRAILPVRDKAKELAPIDSGRLKQSIKRKTGARRGIARAKIVTGTRAELGIDETSSGYYPAAIEYGTRHQAAKSYMRAAITALKESVIDRTGDLIDANIKKQIK